MARSTALAAAALLTMRLRAMAGTLLQGERPVFAFMQSLGTQSVVVLSNVATGLIAARLLGAQGRGVYAAVTIWPVLLAGLATAGLNDAILFQGRRAQQHIQQIVSGALLLSILLSLTAIAIGVLVIPLFLTHYPAEVVLFAELCLGSVIVNSLQIVMKQSFAGTAHYRHFNLMHVLPQVLHLVLLLVVMSFGTLTARTATVTLLMSGVITVVCMWPLFLRVMRPVWSAAIAGARRLFWYSLRAAPSELVFTLATYADRLIVIPMLAQEDLGLYAVAFSLSRLIQFAQPAISSVLFSHMTGQSESDNRQLHDCAARFLVTGLFIGCAVLWVSAETVLSVGYGHEFEAAATPLRYLAIEASLGALAQVTVQLFMARGRPGVVSAIQVIVFVLSLALLLWLVPQFGAVGAAMALMGAAFVRCLLLWGALRIVLGIPAPRPYLTAEDFHYLAKRMK